MIACAAGGVNLFSLALKDGGKEGVGPFLKKVSGPSAAKECKLRVMVHDLSREKIEAEAVGDKIVGVREALEKVFAASGSKRSRGSGESASVTQHVAAFRSPDKARFADVFIFVGAVLFLFQCKKYNDKTELKSILHKERWRMGSLDVAATAAVKGDVSPDADAMSAPRETLLGIIEAFYNATGTKATEVRPFFVTPSERKDLQALEGMLLEVNAETIQAGGSDGWDVKLSRAQITSVDAIRFRPNADLYRPPYALCALGELSFFKIPSPMSSTDYFSIFLFSTFP